MKKEDLYSKQDVMNALNHYLISLNRDLACCENEYGKQVLNNVIVSLKEIVDNFKD